MKLIRCNYCGAANWRHAQRCRRCGLDVRLDRSGSLQRSIAFLIAALAFYVPANIYPVLQSASFGSVEGSTILGGVIQLWEMGDYPVALVILVASIMVPIAKFAILIYLILAIASKECRDVKKMVRLYYLIEITGPWSLIDVFVVLVLAALIHFANITIIPGPGVTSFALMVFLTILSANSLDIRLVGAECEE